MGNVTTRLAGHLVRASMNTAADLQGNIKATKSESVLLLQGTPVHAWKEGNKVHYSGRGLHAGL